MADDTTRRTDSGIEIKPQCTVADLDGFDPDPDGLRLGLPVPAEPYGMDFGTEVDIRTARPHRRLVSVWSGWEQRRSAPTSWPDPRPAEAR